MDDPQTPTPPAPPESVPWWRRAAEIAGLDDEIDAVTGAATSARDWIQSKLPSPSAAQAETARFDAAVKAYRAERARQGQADWDAVAAPVKRFFGNESVRQVGQGVGETLKHDYQDLWTPTPETTAMAEAAHQHISSRSAAMRAALPHLPVHVDTGTTGPFRGLHADVDALKPLDWAVGAQQDWIPNLAVDQAVDMSTPLGAAANLDVPISPALKAAAPLLAKGAGVAAHLAAMPPGFFSRVDKIAEAVSAKGMHPNKLASLLKSGASSEEVAYRKLPEFLASKGNSLVTRDELAAHLAAHPPPEVTRTVLGEPAPPIPFEEWQRRWHEAVHPPPDEESIRRGYDDLVAQTSRIPTRSTKYESYTLPGETAAPGGGTSYRESLTRLRSQPLNPYDAFVAQMEQKYGAGYEHSVMTPEERTQQAMLWDRSQRTPGGMTESEFHSGHFDDPNILVHARTTERLLPALGLRPFEEIEAIVQQAVGAKTPQSLASGAPEVALRKGLITSDEAALYGNAKGFSNYPMPPGERGRFLEEVQSDWHQQGARQGYARDTTADLAKLASEWEAAHRTMMAGEGPESRAAQERMFAITGEMNALHDLAKGVPDAPFKETWPDLALKQQLLDVANRQDLSWLGFTSGKTQAARYDLGKQISSLDYDPHGRRLSAYDHGGNSVIDEFVEPEQLDDYIGKEPADKLRTQIDAHEQRRAYERSQWSTEIDPDTGQYVIIDPNGEVQHDWAGDVERYSQEDFAQHAIDERLRESDEAMQASAARDRDPYLPTLSGLDLQVGGEGMHHFYDQLLPRRLEKLVKPFGGTVERTTIPGGLPEAAHGTRALGEAFFDAAQPGSLINGQLPVGPSRTLFSRDALGEAFVSGRLNAFDMPNYLQDAVQQRGGVGEPAWITRLSPEAKARIRTEGFPLMSLLPPAAAGLGAAGAAHALSGDDDQGGGAGLAAGLAAAVPFLPPGIRRPGLTRSGRAAIEEARAYLQQLGLRGAVPRHELETVLQEAPLAYHAHHVTKGLPAEPPLKAAKRILLPGEQGYDFAPAATTRLHGMADIGAALPQQANWGGATDPALLPAFDNNPQAADLFGRFFAALSPRTSVPKNALEAITVWRDYLQHPGRQFTDARLRELGVGNVRSKTNNLTRAMIGEGPSGPKVDPFTDYMTGQARLPVPDVHGLYAIGSRHGAIDDVVPELRTLVQRHEGIPKKSGGLTEKDYVHRLLDAFGRSLQSYDPAKPMGPLFGSMWEGTRAQKGHAFQGGMIDIYKSRGLTEPGALLDVQALGRAIRDWSRR